MAIARRRTLPLQTSPLPTPSPRPAVLPPGGGSGSTPIPPTDEPVSDGAVAPPGSLRRCTFRRIDKVVAATSRAEPATFAVVCLYYMDDDSPRELGSIDEARPVCASCTATGIFRPDED